MVFQLLRRFVALSAMALESFSNSTVEGSKKLVKVPLKVLVMLHSLAILLVPILRMIFDAVHVLVALFTARHRTCEGLLVGAVGRR